MVRLCRFGVVSRRRRRISDFTCSVWATEMLFSVDGKSISSLYILENDSGIGMVKSNSL